MAVVFHDEVTTAHLHDARLFANRNALMESFSPTSPKVVAEIGVAMGDFSVAMVETFNLDRFIALDTFDMHHYPEHWGRSSKEIFGELTHRQLFEGRLRPLVAELQVLQGLSVETTKLLPDSSIDFLYVDGSHQFDDVMSDAKEALRIVKSSGTIIFNDYIMNDPITKHDYGVVQAVNKIVNTSGWRIVGMALQRHMFCDIALRLQV